MWPGPRSVAAQDAADRRDGFSAWPLEGMQPCLQLEAIQRDLLQPSGVQNCDTINVCHFKPLG